MPTTYTPNAGTNIGNGFVFSISSNAGFGNPFIAAYTPGAGMFQMQIEPTTSHIYWWAPFYNNFVQLSSIVSLTLLQPDTKYEQTFFIKLGVNDKGTTNTADDTITIEQFQTTINGEVVFNLLGTHDTNSPAYSGTNFIGYLNRIVVNYPPTGTLTMDRVYYSTGTPPTGVRDIYTLRPNTSGSTAMWTGTWTGTGTYENWELVDDTIYNPSDYVHTATSGDIDLYNFQNVADTTNVYTNIQVNVIVKQALATAGQVSEFSPTIVSGTATNSKTWNISLSDPGAGWFSDMVVFSTDPATGGAWVGSNINALQAGFKGIP